MAEDTITILPYPRSTVPGSTALVTWNLVKRFNYIGDQYASMHTLAFAKCQSRCASAWARSSPENSTAHPGRGRPARGTAHRGRPRRCRGCRRGARRTWRQALRHSSATTRDPPLAGRSLTDPSPAGRVAPRRIRGSRFGDHRGSRSIRLARARPLGLLGDPSSSAWVAAGPSQEEAHAVSTTDASSRSRNSTSLSRISARSERAPGERERPQSALGGTGVAPGCASASPISSHRRTNHGRSSCEAGLEHVMFAVTIRANGRLLAAFSVCSVSPTTVLGASISDQEDRNADDEQRDRCPKPRCLSSPVRSEVTGVRDEKDECKPDQDRACRSECVCVSTTGTWQWRSRWIATPFPGLDPKSDRARLGPIDGRHEELWAVEQDVDSGNGKEDENERGEGANTSVNYVVHLTCCLVPDPKTDRRTRGCRRR